MPGHPLEQQVGVEAFELYLLTSFDVVPHRMVHELARALGADHTIQEACIEPFTGIVVRLESPTKPVDLEMGSDLRRAVAWTMLDTISPQIAIAVVRAGERSWLT